MTTLLNLGNVFTSFSFLACSPFVGCILGCNLFVGLGRMVLVRIFVVLRKLELVGIVVVGVVRTLVVQLVLGGNVVLHILVRSHLVRIPVGILFGILVLDGRLPYQSLVLGRNMGQQC